jgi:hypothetical protein
MGMKINKETIQNIKDIYFADFGERITDAEAQELAERLVSFYMVIHPPTSNPDQEKIIDLDIL